MLLAVQTFLLWQLIEGAELYQPARILSFLSVYWHFSKENTIVAGQPEPNAASNSRRQHNPDAPIMSTFLGPFMAPLLLVKSNLLSTFLLTNYWVRCCTNKSANLLAFYDHNNRLKRHVLLRLA